MTVELEVEQALDKAHAILMEGLRSEDLSQRLRAAKFILTHSPAAKRRGWGSGQA
jgi:hypothetical protein